MLSGIVRWSLLCHQFTKSDKINLESRQQFKFNTPSDSRVYLFHHWVRIRPHRYAKWPRPSNRLRKTMEPLNRRLANFSLNRRRDRDAGGKRADSLLAPNPPTKLKVPTKRGHWPNVHGIAVAPEWGLHSWHYYLYGKYWADPGGCVCVWQTVVACLGKIARGPVWHWLGWELRKGIEPWHRGMC